MCEWVHMCPGSAQTVRVWTLIFSLHGAGAAVCGAQAEEKNKRSGDGSGMVH